MENDVCFFRKNKWLYHYTSLETAKLIISQMRLKYSQLKKTNDVCEHNKCIYNEIFPIMLPKENFSNDIECEIYHYQQISLSEDKIVFGRRGFDLQQMWGIYGDCGFGACLVFDKNELIRNLPKSCKHGSVVYSADVNPDTFTQITDESEIKTYIESNAKTLFFNKRTEWEHEQEYRIIERFENEETEEYLDIKDCLKYIILYNSKSNYKSESILGSSEYKNLISNLPQSMKVLLYTSFLNELSLIHYIDDENIEEYWSSVGEPINYNDIIWSQQLSVDGM